MTPSILKAILEQTDTKTFCAFFKANQGSELSFKDFDLELCKNFN
jgi:hypothetical protein